MLNKSAYYLLLGVVIAIIFSVIFIMRSGRELEALSESQPKILAVCPTYYGDASKLDQSRYQIIKTASTAESLELIKTGKVDYVIAGRTLKPWEPKLDGVVFAEGYSFLGNEERSLRKADLSEVNLFTDLDIENLKESFDIDNIQKVDDVYEYLNQGIVVTSWENTDYSRAGLIHVMESDGGRVRLSRVGTLYCLEDCNEEAEKIFELLKI